MNPRHVIMKKGGGRLRDANSAVIVAMAGVNKVQMPAHEVIHVVAVWDRLMAARCSMSMRFVMASASMSRRAGGRIGCVDGKDVLINMIPVNVMQVTVVQVILMSLVLNGLMPAIRTMLVGVIIMHAMSLHSSHPM